LPSLPASRTFLTYLPNLPFYLPNLELESRLEFESRTQGLAVKKKEEEVRTVVKVKEW
jgi:hypothetical protein